MPETIFLHCGPHRTGESGVQRSLARAGAELGRAGIVYPETGRIGAGHHGLVNAARRWSGAVDPAALARECAGAETVVISSENIAGLGATELEALRGLLPETDVIRPVFYLRRLVDLWPVHWRELVRHGHWMDFGTYLSFSSLILGEDGRLALNQKLQLDRLAQIFGRENLVLLGYDALTGEGRHPAEPVLADVLGLGAEAMAKLGPAAEDTEGGPLFELVRALNALHREETGQMATAKLRIEVERRCATPGEGFAMWDAFAALVEAGTRPLLLRGHNPMVDHLQRRVVSNYGDLLRGTGAAEAYMVAEERIVGDFTLPLAADPALRAALLDWYRDFPVEARASVKPPF